MKKLIWVLILILNHNALAVSKRHHDIIPPQTCLSLFQRNFPYKRRQPRYVEKQFQRIPYTSYLKSLNNRYIIKAGDNGQIEDVLITFPRIFPTGSARLLWANIIQKDGPFVEFYYADPRKEGGAKRKVYKVTLRKNKNGRIEIYNARTIHPLVLSLMRGNDSNLRYQLYRLGFKKANPNGRTYTFDIDGSTILISQLANQNFIIAGSALVNRENIIDDTLKAIDLRKTGPFDALILQDNSFEYAISPRGGIISVTGVSK